MGRKRKKTAADLFGEHAADTLKGKIKELGITPHKFVTINKNIVSQPTFWRLLNGVGTTSTGNMALLADKLGLKLVLIPKEEENDESEN